MDTLTNHFIPNGMALPSGTIQELLEWMLGANDEAFGRTLAHKFDLFSIRTDRQMLQNGLFGNDSPKSDQRNPPSILLDAF